MGTSKGILATRIAQAYLKNAAGVHAVTLPRGSELFHGTLVNFGGSIRPGGYDDVAWFADNPAIAQLYIPRSGVSVNMSSFFLTKPRKDREGQAVQKAIV